MLRSWIVTLAALAGCDSIFGIHQVGGPPDTVLSTDAPITSGWKQTATGWLHSCGIRADDTVWCWGSNEVSEMGTGVTSGLIEMPTQVSPQPFSEVSSTFQYTCALGLDDDIRCWGDNSHGQLGTGNLSRGDFPRVVNGPWKHVVAGAFTTCAIRNDDTLWCWGYNLWGEVGVGSTMQTPQPTKIGTSTWLDVDVGFYHTCGIMTDNSMWCWGYEPYGEFGNGDDGGANYSYVPKPGPPGSWAKVQAGAYTTCGVTSDRSLRCWGYNGANQLGNGGGAPSHTPQPVLIDGKEVNDWLSVSLDHMSVCGIREDGSLWCWGNDSKDQLGIEVNDKTGNQSTPFQMMQVSPRWRRVDTSLSHTCAIDGDNELYCMGSAARGQLGNGATNHAQPQVMPLAGLKLALAASTTCGLDSSGTTHCAGYDVYGALGDGGSRSRSQPTSMSPPLSGVLVLAPGNLHTCAATASATYCWGYGYRGALGNGATASSTTPVTPTGVPVLGAMASYNHTCGIDKTASASVYCWGANEAGQLGDGSMTDSSTPKIVLAGAAKIAVGPYHTCAILTGGGIDCWGRNIEGEVGIGEMMTDYWTTPQPVTTTLIGTPAAISAGMYHTCVINTAARMFCWGGSQWGQLGQGDALAHSSPVAVGTALWKSVATGMGHTCGVRTDGTLWCWGRNTRGELGLGGYDDHYLQGQVGEDTDWAAVYAGDEHTCGVKTSGQVSCWGGNEEGQTPDGTSWQTTMVLVP